jgi:hypothetical protein
MSERLTKDSIIKALLDAAFSRSTGATSLANVADALHIKKASLYNHFNSREDLIFQTTNSCAEYIREISFIPNDFESVTKKYPPETVLKGLVTRYVKMHEKSPLFQIYTFVESQKYFNPEAAKISTEQKEKLISQTEKILISLSSLGKIKIPGSLIHGTAVWFCSGVNDILDKHLLKRKQVVMANPQTGEGELFSIDPDEKSIEAINALVEEFSLLIK